jgi:hypothetical protein
MLTMEDLQRVCIDAYSHWMDPKGWKRPRNPHSFQCRSEIKHLTRFEDKWDLIHDRLATAAPNPALASLPNNNIEAVTG